MSDWMHACCVTCWNSFRLEPKQDADTLTTCAPEVCCWCSATTTAGIFLRGDPATMPCSGIHMEDVLGGKMELRWPEAVLANRVATRMALKAREVAEESLRRYEATLRERKEQETELEDA